MKKISLFGVIGYGVLVGAIIVWIVKHADENLNNNQKEKISNEKNAIDNSQKDIKNYNEVDLNNIRTQSVNSMNTRHKEAVQVVKDSIEKVNTNVDVPCQYKKDFDNMFEELDNLSEEM